MITWGQPGPDRGLPSLPPLFVQKRDPASGRFHWFPTTACTPKVYDDCRKRLGGVHLIENALWRLPLYDHLAQAYKDTMHGQEHGIQINMLKAIVKEGNLLENNLKIARLLRL